MTPVLARLDNPVRTYDWGSHEVLARLQGRPVPTAEPEAELWLGAHPTDPSTWLDDGHPRSLEAAVAAAPGTLLGATTVARFGPRLPFLLKVLAVARPLSLQVHPTAEQAAAGFARERAAGVALEAPERDYTDPWPKPELIRALTRFDALCGFRAAAATLDLVERLDVAALRWLADALRERGETALRDAVGRLLHLPIGERGALVAQLRSACSALAAHDERWAAHARWIADLAQHYPDDPGVAVAVLLELVQLRPGESLHVPPGTLHCYLSGSCVEIMASSDNVLRGGLTSKHVDVEGLLGVVAAAPQGPWRVTPVVDGRERIHPTPAPEFRLSELDPGGGEVVLDHRGAQLLFVADGASDVAADGTSLSLAAGQGAFVAAAASRVVVSGDATVFRATVGDPPTG